MSNHVSHEICIAALQITVISDHLCDLSLHYKLKWIPSGPRGHTSLSERSEDGLGS